MQYFSPLAPPKIAKRGVNDTWGGLKGSTDALAVMQAALGLTGPAIVVTSNSREFDYFVGCLEFFSQQGDNIPVIPFPSWECLPYDAFSPHEDITSRRLAILARLSTLSRGVVVISIEELMQRLPPASYIKGHSFAIEVGDKLDAEKFRQQLFESAYRMVPQVETHGEYAVRGGVIDVFPMGSDYPVRIELFDDEIDTLRYFRVDEQRSFQKIQKFVVLPGSEIPMTQDGVNRFRTKFQELFPVEPRANRIYREIDSGKIPGGAEFYIPLFFESTSEFFEYLPNNACLFVSRGTFEAAKTFWKQVEERYQITSNYPHQQPLPPDLLYLRPEQVKNNILAENCIILSPRHQPKGKRFRVGEPVNFTSSLFMGNSFENLKVQLSRTKGKTFFAVDTSGQQAIVESAIKALDLQYSTSHNWQKLVNDAETDIAINVVHLPRGLTLPERKLNIISSAEIFGPKASTPLSTSSETTEKPSPQRIQAMLEELHEGDPVVHEIYGVGRYVGLESMSFEDYDAEFMIIQYAGTDKLYVPVYAIDSVSRYVSIDRENIPLHALSSKTWERTRKKARQKVYDIAAELLQLQALRQSNQSPPMHCETELYNEFVAQFPFNETIDQIHTEKDVLSDLASTTPMDRLVCGDAGFGKTEIALRAAFVAYSNGFQVAIVVPTTILAQQHYDVFVDRFASWGTKIGIFSRLQKTSTVKNIATQLKEGKLDIAIGTTRLLQADIEFKSLGLLVIDEEHRFGVKQKEYLKQKRTNVNVLTLSATPIPRTLSMALNRLRELSLIATPPDNRVAIHTFLRDWSADLIREACLRELGRGGQIFYVHNEVKTIQKVARQLATIIPEANIRVGHGQMSKLELKQIMKQFYLQQFNLLVCTTIIESGLDIPTANTIIINGATKFGLAQLYQLRGRVGRSHHQAYAYLLVESIVYLPRDSRRRLEAIEELHQLGAGYVVATHDLEIRGAGTLLGDAQSGTIDTVGYSLYSSYLFEAVDYLTKPGAETQVEKFLSGQRHKCEVNLHVPTIIPEYWIPDVNIRLTFYKRIASSININQIKALREELKDRFGKLPAPVESLLNTAELRMKADRIGIRKLDIGPDSALLKFSSDTSFDPAGLIQAINDYPGTIQIDNDKSELKITHSLDSVAERVTHTALLLDGISLQEKTTQIGQCL